MSTFIKDYNDDDDDDGFLLFSAFARRVTAQRLTFARDGVRQRRPIQFVPASLTDNEQAGTTTDNRHDTVRRATAIAGLCNVSGLYYEVSDTHLHTHRPLVASRPFTIITTA